MLVDKKKIIEHLQRLYSGGEIKEAVLYGAFGSHALNGDQQLIVVVPPLPKVEALAEEVGILDLDMMIKLIGTLSADAGDVGIEIKGGKMVAEQKHGGKIRMVVGSPGSISSRIGADKIEKARDYIKANGTEVPLDQTTVHGVLETAKLLKATHVVVYVGPDGGRIEVGRAHEQSHSAEFPMAALKSDQPYKLIISSKLLTAVFNQISDFTQAVLIITGPDAFFVVKEGEYLWIISPQIEDTAK